MKRLLLLILIVAVNLCWAQRASRVQGSLAGVYGGWGAEINTPVLGIAYGQRVSEKAIFSILLGKYFESEQVTDIAYLVQNAYELRTKFEVPFGENTFKFQPIIGLNYMFYNEKSNPRKGIDSLLIEENTYNKVRHLFGIMLGASFRFDFENGLNPFIEISYLAGGISQLYVGGGLLKKFEWQRKKRFTKRFR